MINKKSLLLIVVVFLFLIAGLIYFLFYTTAGSSFLVKTALNYYIGSKYISIKKIEGSLSKGISFHDIQASQLKALPQESILKIQRLDVKFSSFNSNTLNLAVFNGRLFLPNSEAIVFDGDYKKSVLDINAYSRSIGVRHTLDLFAENTALKAISGSLSNLNIYVKGSLFKPKLSGELNIESLQRNDFLLTDSQINFAIEFNDIRSKLKAYGSIIFNNGIILAKNTLIKLQKGKIEFTGEPLNPTVDFKGGSTIDGVKINIALKGDVNAPDLRLNSTPPMSNARLLIMLATGKSWKGSEDAFKQSRLTPDLAKDLLDYFVFAGQGNKLINELGLSGISLKFEKDTKGIGIKKSLTGQTDVNFAIEETGKEEGASAEVSQKVGISQKITDIISIEGEREIKKEQEKQQDEEQKPDDKILLKIEKDF